MNPNPGPTPMDEAPPDAVPCHYCGLWVGMSRDHVVATSVARPRYAGEPARHDNIVRACRDCNTHKSSKRVLHNCTACHLAWIKYGLPGWTTNVETATLKQVTGRARGRYKGYLRTRSRSRRWVDQFPEPCQTV